MDLDGRGGCRGFGHPVLRGELDSEIPCLYFPSNRNNNELASLFQKVQMYLMTKNWSTNRLTTELGSLCSVPEFLFPLGDGRLVVCVIRINRVFLSLLG